MRAFYERVRARRGAQVAAVATARKLASLCWCLLTREQDYAFAQPSLTRRKIRKLDSPPGATRARASAAPATATATRRSVTPSAPSPNRPRAPTDRRSPTGRPAAGEEGGRERDTGARITKALEGQSRAADHKPLTSALRYVNRPHPTNDPTGAAARPAPLTFIRQSRTEIPLTPLEVLQISGLRERETSWWSPQFAFFSSGLRHWGARECLNAVALVAAYREVTV